MIHLPSENDFNLSNDQTGPLSPVKQCPLSLDLSDFLSSKTPQTPSSLSIYDSGSTKGDDDKLCGIELLRISALKTSESWSSIDGSPLDRNMTLSEIISKRSYTRHPKKDGKKAKKTSEATANGKRRRKQTKNDNELEEVIFKKEKHENGGYKEIAGTNNNVPALPEIVFKDGKATLVQPEISMNNANINHKLEIVQPNKKKVTTSTSFKQINHTEKWTDKETGKFYRALELFGTDFSMIAKVFKNRNRNQIKNKFLREEKMAPEKVNGTFKNVRTASFQTLFTKFEKHKKSQKNTQSIKADPAIENNCLKAEPTFAVPSRKTSNAQEAIQGLELVQRARNERSGSFYSSASIDSVDLSIMEDLADILMPQKTLFGL